MTENEFPIGGQIRLPGHFGEAVVLEAPATAIDVRFIEVKGRAGVGEAALSTNEYRTAERLKGDYWLYVVYNCGSTPEVHAIRNPARLGWKPIVTVEHYACDPSSILATEEEGR